MSQGHFEILSLSGSYLLAEDGDTRSRTGGLSVALVGSDGRIVGGCVAGMLMAATLVQVLHIHVFFALCFQLASASKSASQESFCDRLPYCVSGCGGQLHR